MTPPLLSDPPAAGSDAATSPVAAATGIPYERFLACVHCGLCTAACPTYLETGNENDSPRGRIYLMRAVTDGRLELTPQVQRHLELCLDCRSCETACPSGVQYGRLIEPFRAAVHAGKLPTASGSKGAASRPAAAPRPGWFERWILYGLFPHPRRLRWSLAVARGMQRLGLDRLAERIGLTELLPEKLRRMQRLLPRLEPSLPPLPERLPPLSWTGERWLPGGDRPPRARVALFTGCVADAMFRSTHWATARVLQANGCEVLVPRSQVCCGAIHYHSGAADPAVRLADTNSRTFPPDVDAVIVNVAGCGSMLKDYVHLAEETTPGEAGLAARLGDLAARVRDVAEFLAELGPVPPPYPVKLCGVYHDACHLCHAQKIREQPRRLLELVRELTVLPLAESDICCGAAGSYNLTEPEMADQLGRRKVANILATGAEVVITGNAGCSLQIQALLRECGAPRPVVHPLDLLARAYFGEAWRPGAELPSPPHPPRER